MTTIASTLNVSQVKNGMNSLIGKTCTLKQALKAFSGLGAERLANTAMGDDGKIRKDCDGLTVAEFFQGLGITYKNALKLEHIGAAWSDELKLPIVGDDGKPETYADGKEKRGFAVFKNVTVMHTVTLAESKKGCGEVGQKVPVYDANGKKLSVRKLVMCEEGQWTTKLIGLGLVQSHTIQAEIEKSEKSYAKLAALSCGYIQASTTEKFVDAKTKKTVERNVHSLVQVRVSTLKY